MAKAIQSDSEDCSNLIKRTTSLMIVILDSLKGKIEGEIPDYLKLAIERLSRNFHEVLDELKIIEKRVGKRSSTSIARGILYHFDNTEKLKGCSAKLDWAINEFQVTSKVDSCLKDLERHEELRQGQAELRKGQGVLQEGQEKLQDDLADIRKAIKEKVNANAPLSLPSTVMPANPKIFGRQSYINKAVQLILSANSTRIVILGPGGMGKTSVALRTAHDPRIIERFGIHRRWVPCEQATSVPLFVELIAKSLGLPPSTSNDRFGEIVAALEESDTLEFVLFDNFETLWDVEAERSSIANILSRLASIPSVSLMLTMRGIQHPASDLIDWTSPRLPPLTPLEMDPAQEAFLKISPDSEGEPDLPELLRELDCMPLAITLMAKLAEVGEPVTELLSQWRKEQVKLLSQPNGDRTSSIEVSIRSSLTSSPVRTSADAIPLLSVLARLPGGASLARLPSLCPSITGWKGALRVLRTAALVFDSPDKSGVHILSPIRSYVLLHHPIAEGLIQDLQNAYYDIAAKGSAYIGDFDFVDVATELSKEEINLDTIIIDALHNAADKDPAIAAALAYSNYLALTQPRVNVIENAIQAARDAGSEHLAECLHRYGGILRYQSQYDSACIALAEARDRYRQLGKTLSVADCLWLSGDILRFQDQYDEACSILEEAKRQYMKVNAPVGAANCLWALGVIYETQGRSQMALSTLEDARSQYMGVKSDLGVAHCLQSLGRLHRTQGSYEAAVSAAEEAKAMYTKLLDPNDIAHTLLLLSLIYYDQGHYSNAYSKVEEAMAIYARRGEKISIAICFGVMGSILFKQRRYDEAHRCAEEAENEFVKLRNREGIADSRRLLGDIYRMKGEYDKACSLLEEAKSRFAQHDNSLNVRLGLADCNSSLGKISRLHGQYEEAIKLLDEARTTYSTIGSRKLDAAECTQEIDLALKARGTCEQAG